MWSRESPSPNRSSGRSERRPGSPWSHPRLCGIKQFQTEQGARYVVLLYRADRFSGTLTSSDEGEVFWVERGALGRCRLSADFQEMLKIFECCDLSEFYYYRDGEAWAHALL